MNEIADLLDSRCIELSLRARRKRDAIREMVGLFVKAGYITDPAKIENGLWERERLMTTAVGHGIAIPHYLSTTMPRSVMAVGRSTPGINFRAIDGLAVELIIMLVGPLGHESQQLRILSRLSRFLSEETFRKQLLAARQEEEIVDLFRKRETGED